MSNTARVIGGGNIGEPLKLNVVPDATLKAAIDALIAAGTVVEGLLLKFATSAAYTVSLCADQEAPECIVTGWRRNIADGTYDLAVEVLANCVMTLPYRTGSTVALGAHIRVEGSDSYLVETDAAATVGKVLRINTSRLTVDVLF